MPKRSSQLSDPVAAYDRLAPHYADIASARRPYLDSIERQIIHRIPAGSRSLLDVGAGDGSRTLRIAKTAGLADVVLLEPSQMAKACPSATEIWAIRAEELALDEPSARAERRFDIILCLWNVLGHIRPEINRIRVLRKLSAALTPHGVLFVDVNHRYNIRSYGAWKTVGRFLLDRLRPSETNGDVTASWNFDSDYYSTYGHVFTDREIKRLAAASQLQIEERMVVDYDTGAVRPLGFRGNLLYMFGRSEPECECGLPI